MHNEVKRKLILSIRIEINDNEKMYGIENVKQEQFFQTNIKDDVYYAMIDKINKIVMIGFLIKIIVLLIFPYLPNK